MRPIHFPQNPAGHAAPLTHVAVAKSGLVATASYDGSILIWDATVVQVLARLPHLRLTNSSAWSHDSRYLATASADKTIAIWDLVDPQNPTLERCLIRHTDDINAVAWSPTGDRLVAVSEDHTVTVWDPTSGQFLGTPVSHAGHCMAVDISVAGVVATVGEDGRVNVLHDLADTSAGPLTQDHGVSIEGCAWSPDGATLALACDDGTVRFTDPALDSIRSFTVSGSAVRSVAWLDDGERVVVGSYDGSIRICTASDGRVLAVSNDGRLWPRSVAVDGAGRIIAGSFGASPVIYDADDLACMSPGGPATFGPNALATGQGLTFIGLDSGDVLVIDGPLIGPRNKRLVTIGDKPVLALGAVSSGFVVGTYSGAVELRSSQGELIDQLAGSDDPITSISVSPGGDQVAIGNYGGTITLVNLTPEGLSAVWSKQLHGGSVKSLSWLSSTQIVSGATDNKVATIDAATGAIDTFYQHGNLVNSVATADGAIVSGARDRSVRVDVAGATHVLLGSDESVKAVFVHAGKTHLTVLAGSYDFGVYSWRVPYERTLRGPAAATPLHHFDQSVSCIAPGPTADTALVCSWDGTILPLQFTDSGVEPLASVRVNDLLPDQRDVREREDVAEERHAV